MTEQSVSSIPMKGEPMLSTLAIVCFAISALGFGVAFVTQLLYLVFG